MPRTIIRAACLSGIGLLAVAVLAIAPANVLLPPVSAQAELLFAPEVVVQGIRQLPLTGIKWGGPIVSVAANPRNFFELLAASASGGLFKSTDLGATWSHLDGLPVSELSAVVYNQDASLMLVTARDDWRAPNNGAGIWSSGDGGANWRQASTVRVSPRRFPPGFPTGVVRYCRTRPMAFGIAVDPSSDRIFVASTCGILQSANKGANFFTNDLGDEPDGTPRTFYSVAVVPPNPALPAGAVVAGGPAGIYYADDDGRSVPMTAATGTIGLASNGSDGNFRHAITHSLSNRFPQDLFATVDPVPPVSPDADDARPAVVWSRDGGRTWQTVPIPAGDGYSANCGGSPFVRTSLKPGADAMYLYYGDGFTVWRATLPGEDAATLLDPDPSKRPPWQVLALPHPDPHESLVAGFSALVIATDGGILMCDQDDFVCPADGVRGAAAGLNALQATRVNGQKILDWPEFRYPESHLYFSTWHTGVWASADGGGNWTGFDTGEGDSLDMSRFAAGRADSIVGMDWCADCRNLVTGPILEGPRDWPDVVPTAPPDAPTRGSGPPTFIRYFGSVFAQQSRSMVDGASIWMQTHVTTDATAANTRIANLRSCAGGGTGCVVLNPRSTQPHFPGYATLDPLNAALYSVVDSNVTYERTTVPRFTLLYLDGFLSTAGRPDDVDVFPADVWFQWMERDRARGRVGLGANPAAGLRRPVFAADPQAVGHLIAPDVNHEIPGEIGMRESFDAGNIWIARPDLDLLVAGTGFNFDIDTREKPNYFPTGEYWPLVSAISFFPDNAQLVVMGTMNNGLFFSNDRGRTWRHVDGSEQIPSINDIYWKSANSVFVASSGRGLWEIQLALRAPLVHLSALCPDCRLLPVIPLPTDGPVAPSATPAAPDASGFDSALLVLDGRVQDASATANGVGAVVGPGSTWMMMSDLKSPPVVPITEDSKPGSFTGIPQAAGLVQQGFVIRGLTFAQNRVQGILYGSSDVVLPPAPFVPLQKPGGSKTLHLDGPYLTLFAQDLHGSSLPAGDTLTVKGQNIKPNGGPLQLSVDGRILSQDVKLDQDGNFTFSLAGFRAGQHNLLVTQGATKPNPTLASIAFHVTHADEREDKKQP